MQWINADIWYPLSMWDNPQSLTADIHRGYSRGHKHEGQRSLFIGQYSLHLTSCTI